MGPHPNPPRPLVTKQTLFLRATPAWQAIEVSNPARQGLEARLGPAHRLWSGRQESNLHTPAYETGALPIELPPVGNSAGIEPSNSDFTDRRSTFEPRTPCPAQDSNLHPMASQAIARPLSFQGMYPGERGSGETKTRVIGRNYVANPPHLPPIHRMVREPKPSLDAISLQLSKCLCGGLLHPASPCRAASKIVSKLLRIQERPPLRAA